MDKTEAIAVGSIGTIVVSCVVGSQLVDPTIVETIKDTASNICVPLIGLASGIIAGRIINGKSFNPLSDPPDTLITTPALVGANMGLIHVCEQFGIDPNGGLSVAMHFGANSLISLIRPLQALIQKQMKPDASDSELNNADVKFEGGWKRSLFLTLANTFLPPSAAIWANLAFSSFQAKESLRK